MRKKDVIGLMVGRLQVLEQRYEKIGNRNVSICKIKCFCGKNKNIRMANLHKTKSCGCLRGNKSTRAYCLKENLVGEKIGLLTIESQFRDSIVKTTFCICICECGNKKVVAKGNIVSGSVRSCGCLVKVTRHNGNQETSDVAFNQVWNYYKRNAKARGIGFFLSKEEFYDLISSSCEYCGIEKGNTSRLKPKLNGEERVFKFNGIDRKDNLRPYEKDNCASACKRCNQAKNDMTQEEFFTWIERVSTFYGEKNDR